MIDLEPLRWPLVAAYLLLLLLIGVYGLHRCWLLVLYRRHRRPLRRRSRRVDGPLPRVTVQLPMFNEAAVARRVIDAACAIEYPPHRLQIQVLDDSTDRCAKIARQRAAYWAGRGIDIQYLHREDRTGYKAGALGDALAHATGELIAIFDADFVPPRTFLKRTVGHFADPGVGMVQACWTHLNREDSLLTRAQAIFLDGHFVVEHTARNRSGAWINFNGTAGVWRRAAIESGGGWQHDTLTEDVDLSYRAQLAGWRFVFLPRVRCPAELPPEINAFRSQQHRWTKGSIQVAMKLLPTLLRAPLPMRVKIEALFHLTCPMVYLYVTLLALLLYPAMLAVRGWGGHEWIGAVVGPIWLMLGTFSALLFYIASQQAQHRSVWRTVLQAPLLMAVGVGIAVSNAVGCVEALLGHDSPFVRTPKFGKGAGGEGGAGPGDAGAFCTPRASSACVPPVSPREKLGEGGVRAAADNVHSARAVGAAHFESPLLSRSLRREGRQRCAGPFPVLCVIEIAMGLYMLTCAYLALTRGEAPTALPFLLLFAAGYLYVGLSSAAPHLGSVRMVWPQAASDGASAGVGAAVTSD